MTETEYLEKIEAAFLWIESQIDTWNGRHDLVLEFGRHGPEVEVEFE